jgi:hypothetical protein
VVKITRMTNTSRIDIKENALLRMDDGILETLLKDHSTDKNIIWATDNYEQLGDGYSFSDEIKIPLITGKNGDIIQPRVSKDKETQLKRVRDKAEVFTPCWICNAQNNLVDEAWFGQKNVFNKETDKDWETNMHPVMFPTNDGKTWQDYLNDTRLEITCGEAPYLVSRYGAVNGKPIPLKRRIGMLDRKMRIVCERAGDDWMHYALIAYQNIYGYEWQGDNLLIARENLLYSFIDYYDNYFGEKPATDDLKHIAEIISWNIWQMDGLKGVVPCSCHEETKINKDFFGQTETKNQCPGCEKNDITKHNGIYCKIMDWEKNEPIRFISLIKK